MSGTELDVVLRKHAALREELTHSGALLSGAGFAYPEETTVVRLGANGVVARSGPLATGSDEHLTAYYVIESEDADQARSVAERVLDHHVTAVEVRRIHDSAGM
jgi:hypothetical protein